MRFQSPLTVFSLLALTACQEAAPDVREQACAALATTWSVEDAMPAPPEGCVAQAPPPRDLSSSPKLAVAVYHFNIQYVAGGLQGFLGGNGAYDLDEAEVEDRIVRQGLEPVLDLFLAHETFKADVELQAYMVEVIAARHPDVLEKMRTLALRGQIEFDSFHYSDQLYVAYPRDDLERSLDLVDDVFARACLPRGGTVFAQEGQFAAGQIPTAAARGFTTSILAKNLFRHQHGEEPMQAAVLYEDPAHPGHAVLLGGRSWASPAGDLELQWTFMDDGEIAFSRGELNPYFGEDYVVDEDALAAHAARLAEMEAQGYVHATVREAVAAMRARGVVPAPLPPTLDGTWQPDDTGNVYRWMGGAGLWRPHERDSDVLAAVWRGSRAAAFALGAAGDDARARRGAKAALREALLAEVSDSTGWNPFFREIEYSLAHAAEAERLAGLVATCAGTTRPPPARPSCEGDPGTKLSDLGLEVVAPAREVDVEIARCEAPAPGARAVRVTLSVDKLAEEEPDIDDDALHTLQRELDVHAALSVDEIVLSPAFSDEVRTFPLSSFAFASTGVALPDGMVGLGGDRFLVQDLSTGRVAAVFAREGDGAGEVRLLDHTVTRAAASARALYVLEGVDASQARAFARRLNGVD